ncbi:glucosyltransferase domain-containing protein [Proteus mirabilis]|uniref:glucosyltransferase domain-containing protein n=1 Tax=Proteus mirabilis TaxID=584 RepID=UPI0013300A99
MKTIELKKISIFFLIAMLFYYPIIYSNVYYRDDLDRAISGYYGWSSMGRPLADLTLKFIMSWSELSVDIFPLNVFLSCAFISLSCYLISEKILNDKNELNRFLISALFIINPFFLQNVLYRFDSISMSLSILLCTISYVLINEKKVPKIILGVIFSVFSLSLYQPCFNVFLGFISIDLMQSVYKNKQLILRNLVYKTLAFITCYFIYYITVAKIFVTNSRSSIVSFDKNGFRNITETNEKLIDLLSIPLATIGMLSISICSLVLISALVMKCIIRKKIYPPQLFISLISFLFIYFSFLGPTFILKEPPLVPRGITSTPFVLMLFFIIMFITIKKYKAIIYISLVLLVTPLFSSSYQLGNSLKNQRDYEIAYFNMINYDITRSLCFNPDKIMVSGTLGYAPSVINTIKRNPLVKSILSKSDNFQASFLLSIVGVNGVETAYGKQKKYNDIIKNSNDEDLILVSSHYVFYKHEESLLIELR